MEKVRYLVKSVSHQNYIHGEIKVRLNLGDVFATIQFRIF